ncbi:(-)-alpha-pinene synthase-like [Rosa rugosa]|uniref:(-)-alpha-pinene synthase-like n=1 Tax=Rosa rugosa TaxID=74645 RepID=UPI002B40313D|nr:(-)-alpha-pinene synthase-like [Rosa rugosa]
MSSMPIISASFQVPQVAKPEIVRRTANFPPSIWGDRFINYDSQHTKTDAIWQQQVEKLKTVVKREVFTNEGDFSHRLKFIDAIQRLGVAYQFEHEIEESLQHIHAKYHHDQYRDDNHLYNAALCFQLLRQHGYHISSDIFNKFKDSNGSFKKCLIADPCGMLSLYEATHLRVNEEDILEEALLFTTAQLESVLNNNVSYPALLTEQITEALKRPLRKSLERLCAKCYMSVYQDEASHSESLLKLAKLDFNLVQSLHQKELCDVTRWWRKLDFEKKLPFARDRVVELFFWIVGVYFEPQYSTGRIIMTKVAVLLIVLDDIYDAYGTFEELVIFTKAIDRWDLKCIDEFPDYMKIFYYELLNLFNEIDEVISKEGRSHRVSYAIQAIPRSYFNEAQWLHEGRIPSMEEYMRVATVSISYTFLTTISLLGMEDIVTKEAFEWLMNDPKILRASNTIFRLMDDIVSTKFEKVRGHAPSSIDCYMKQYGVSEQETVDVFNKKVADLWKDINEEFLRPTVMPTPVLVRVLNLTRVTDLLYKGEDGFTRVGKMTKDCVAALLVDPVPL